MFACTPAQTAQLRRHIHASEFGKLKWELPEETIEGFVGVAAKTYALKLKSGHAYVRAKGLNFGANTEVLSYDNLRKIVVGDVQEYVLRAATMVRNKQREIYWRETEKRLRSSYDKRERVRDGVQGGAVDAFTKTVPWGWKARAQ